MVDSKLQKKKINSLEELEDNKIKVMKQQKYKKRIDKFYEEPIILFVYISKTNLIIIKFN